jgi:hypothetical protein
MLVELCAKSKMSRKWKCKTYLCKIQRCVVIDSLYHISKIVWSKLRYRILIPYYTSQQRDLKSKELALLKRCGTGLGPNSKDINSRRAWSQVIREE